MEYQHHADTLREGSWGGDATQVGISNQQKYNKVLHTAQVNSCDMPCTEVNIGLEGSVYS